jgi:hypothetical protein
MIKFLSASNVGKRSWNTVRYVNYTFNSKVKFDTIGSDVTAKSFSKGTQRIRISWRSATSDSEYGCLSKLSSINLNASITSTSVEIPRTGRRPEYDSRLNSPAIYSDAPFRAASKP